MPGESAWPAWITGKNPDGSPCEPGRAWAIYASHIDTYMRRWIVRTPYGTLRVHQFLRPDPDRHRHDHPFDFVSLIVVGGYGEDLEGAPLAWHGVGSLLIRRAEQAHRIVSVKPGTTTFVVSGAVRRKWGFWVDGKWMYWRTYFGGGQ